jgi:hypothetical protein
MWYIYTIDTVEYHPVLKNKQEPLSFAKNIDESRKYYVY